MPAPQPTILATSGGYRYGERTQLEFNGLVRHAVELSGSARSRPRVTHLGTASGDQRYFNDWMSDAARHAGYELTNLNLFPMPNLDDVEGHLLEQDAVWVNGGSVANLLAVWGVHGLGFLPYGNGVHYDSEDRRRPLVHRLVADGTLPTTHCTDDGVGLVYHGTELVEAVSEQDGKGAYVVTRDGEVAAEERLEPRRL